LFLTPLLALLFIAPASGQSTLIFPQALPPSSFATTGFAIVNPGSSAASITFTLNGANGQQLSSAQTIPPGGQIAKLASELFPTALSAGWVQATSTASGLQGMWVGGDFATYTDGGEAAPVATDLIFPLITPTSTVSIANPGDNSINALFRLYGGDGLELGIPAFALLPSKGFYTVLVSKLFPTANLSLATHVRVTGGPVSGTMVARDFLAAPSSCAVNAVSAASTATELLFPHAIDGLLGSSVYTSVLGITNLASFDQVVTITFTLKSGVAPLVVQQTLAANGALRRDIHELFGLPSGFQEGWIQVRGSLPLAGVLTYAESSQGAVTAVAGQSIGSKNFFFGHIADIGPWITGVGLLNSSDTTANVEVFAMNPAGTLIGGAADTVTAAFALPPRTKIARLLRELIPQTHDRTSDGGFIFVRSDVGLQGMALFFDSRVSILANIPAAPLPAGITYTPPQR